MKASLTVVIPVCNECETTLANIVRELAALGEARALAMEIFIVDDGSSRPIGEIRGAKVIRHPYNIGNGAAIKTGVRNAKGEITVFMDGDGQHDPKDVVRLLDKLQEGYDMVVGARSAKSQASVGRFFANWVYNRLGSWMVGNRILDLTSGFRATRTDKFREFLYLLPNGFSYPTTSTMAFFRAGYTVGYIPIDAGRREGKSHIRPLKDSIRFFLIIFRVGTLYSPLKLFFPISVLHLLAGIGYYGYTYMAFSRFSNMSALLITTAIIVFLIGIVSEQITNLLYSKTGNG